MPVCGILNSLLPSPQVLAYGVLDILAKIVFSTLIFIKHPLINDACVPPLPPPTCTRGTHGRAQPDNTCCSRCMLKLPLEGQHRRAASKAQACS